MKERNPDLLKILRIGDRCLKELEQIMDLGNSAGVGQPQPIEEKLTNRVARQKRMAGLSYPLNFSFTFEAQSGDSRPIK